MKPCLAFILLLGLAAAESAWRPGKVYRYKHEFQPLLGFPELNSPLKPAALTCDIQIQPVSSSSLNVQLKDLQEVERKEDEERSEGKTAAYPMSEPFEVQMKNGVVTGLNVSPQLPWQALQIVKAKMGVLNLNLQGVDMYGRQPVQKAHTSNPEIDVFTVYEEQHYGLCETTYSISPLPEHLVRCVVNPKEPCGQESHESEEGEHLLVVKTVDYHKCKTPRSFSHTTPPVANISALTSLADSLYTRIVTTQYVLHGDKSNFVIKNINHTEKVALNPLRGKTQKVVLETRSTWQLENVEEGYEPGQLPFTPKHERSIIGETHPSWIYNAAQSLTKSPWPRLPENTEVLVDKVIKNLENISVEIEEYKENEKSTVNSKILAIVDMMKFFELHQIEEVYQKITSSNSPDKEETMVKVFLDACVWCGTNPCVTFVKEMIVQKKVSGMFASLLIQTIPATIKTPSPEIIRELIKLSEEVEYSEGLYTNALLALSNILYHNCVKQATSSPQNMVFCNARSPVVGDFVNYLIQKLKIPNRNSIKVAIVKALSNIATREAMNELYDIILDIKSDNQYLRLHAIASLDRALTHHREEIQAILFEVFINMREHHEPRIAALSVILFAEPTKNILIPLALSTWYEPSRQVQTFIETALKNLAQAGPPLRPEIKLAAKAALALSRPTRVRVPYSFHVVIADEIRSLNVGAIFEASSIGSTNSFIPKFFRSTLFREEGTPYKAIEASFAQEGFGGNLKHIFTPYGFEYIQSKLGMKVPESPHPYPFGAAPETLTTWLRVNDVIEGILTWGSEGQSNIFNQLVNAFFDLDYKLRKGININFQKTIPLVDTAVTIPTELGYPATIRIALPVTISLKADLQWGRNLKAHQPIIDTHIQPLITADYVSTVILPNWLLESMPYAQVGVIAHAHAGLPVAFSTELRGPDFLDQTTIVKPLDGQKPELIPFSYFSAPYTALEPITSFGIPLVGLSSFRIQTQEEPRSRRFPCEIASQLFGIDIDLHHETDTPMKGSPDIYTWFWKNIRNPLSLLNFPYYSVENLLNYNKLALTYKPLTSDTKEISTAYKIFTSEPKVVKEALEPEECAGSDACEFSPDLMSDRNYNSRRYSSRIRNPRMMTEVNIRVPTPLEASPLEGGTVYNIETVYTFAGARPRVFKKLLSVVTSDGIKVQHAIADFEATPIPQISQEPYKVKIEGSGANHGEEAHYNVRVKFGPTNKEPEKANLKLKLKQKQRQLVPTEGLPKIDTLDAKLTYNPEAVPQMVHRILYGAEGLMKFVLYPYMAREYVPTRNQLPYGHINVQANIQPKYNICSIHIQQKQEKLKFEGIPVSPMIKEIIQNSHNVQGLEGVLNHASDNDYNPVCRVKNFTVDTFDHAKFNLSTDFLPQRKWVLISIHKDHPESPVVYLEKTPDGRAVSILSDGANITLTPKPSWPHGYQPIINGEPKPLTKAQPISVGGHNNTIISVSVSDRQPKRLEVESKDHGFKLTTFFDTINIYIRARDEGEMSGICGNNNGEPSDDHPNHHNSSNWSTTTKEPFTTEEPIATVIPYTIDYDYDNETDEEPEDEPENNPFYNFIRKFNF